MSHTPHELAEEFPNDTQKIHDLKLENAHFLKLTELYHEVNREIHRIETGVEAASGIHETSLRKQRLMLKDQIAEMLGKA
ncbi:MAG: DUF465 domain-containing protein [Lentilitoribacter sp.]